MTEEIKEQVDNSSDNVHMIGGILVADIIFTMFIAAVTRLSTTFDIINSIVFLGLLMVFLAVWTDSKYNAKTESE